MRRKYMFAGLLFVVFCAFMLPSIWSRFSKLPDEKLKQYKTITLDTPTTCDLALIPLIEYLRNRSLCATRKITGDDELAISVTLYSTSDWKLKKRTVLAFNGLTIYEAFKKVATDFSTPLCFYLKNNLEYPLCPSVSQWQKIGCGYAALGSLCLPRQGVVPLAG